MQYICDRLRRNMQTNMYIYADIMNIYAGYNFVKNVMWFVANATIFDRFLLQMQRFYVQMDIK